MKIGCPREIKPQEFRVGLTPAAVAEAVGRGHDVLVETGAGLGAGFADADYAAAGATIAPDAASVFAAAEMIVKVKEPQPAERRMLHRDQVLFAYLHLAPDPDQTRDLLESGVTAIAYETVTDLRGGLPLLAPMSESQAGWPPRSDPGRCKRPMADAACCWAGCRASGRAMSSSWAGAWSAPPRRAWRSAWAPT